MDARVEEGGWIWDMGAHQDVLRFIERLFVLGEARKVTLSAWSVIH